MTALTQGAHHIGLTVPDVEQARSFFCDTLGFNVIGGIPEYPAHFVSDGTTMLTLWQVQDQDNAVAFDRKTNIGLHHLALAVADEAALDAVAQAVKALPDAEIEFGPGPMMEGSSTQHMIALIPGGIRVEFATPFA